MPNQSSSHSTKNLFRSALLIVCLVLISGYYTIGAVPTHKSWNKLLQSHVNADGWVDYNGFMQDKQLLQSYLDTLSNNAPQTSWACNDKMAFWINAYNAFTIKLILEHYPVKSIKDIGPDIQIVRINTPWQIKFIPIDGRKWKLDDLENKILRRAFHDARIHFAIVCASRSCARLRNEAYTGAKLEAQLLEQTQKFLRNPAKNNFISASKAELSPYFKWFSGDFKDQSGSVIKFINQYADTKLDENADIDYKDYDWSINDQR